MNNEAGRKLVTVNINAAHQPTTLETGKTGEWYAVRCEYVVDSFTAYEDDCSCVTHSGFRDEDAAKRYARSAGDARPRRVSPYWYVPNFGRVGGTLTYAENQAYYAAAG